MINTVTAPNPTSLCPTFGSLKPGDMFTFSSGGNTIYMVVQGFGPKGAVRLKDGSVLEPKDNAGCIPVDYVEIMRQK